jgi:hypothetical protein
MQGRCFDRWQMRVVESLTNRACTKRAGQNRNYILGIGLDHVVDVTGTYTRASSILKTFSCDGGVSRRPKPVRTLLRNRTEVSKK